MAAISPDSGSPVASAAGANAADGPKDVLVEARRVLVCVEDLGRRCWQPVQKHFEARVPLRRLILNNKFGSPALVTSLPVEFALASDPRILGLARLGKDPMHSYRTPYAKLFLVTCEEIDDYKTFYKENIRPKLRSAIEQEQYEWCIVYIESPVLVAADPSYSKKLFDKVKDDFNTRKRKRCCKLPAKFWEGGAAAWQDVEDKVAECIQLCFDQRRTWYEAEVRRMSEQRFAADGDFARFFLVKESLAFMFELAGLHEDALYEYDELEAAFAETMKGAMFTKHGFGGMDVGDDWASLLDYKRKPLLFMANRAMEVAERSLAFIQAFSFTLARHQDLFSPGFRELWVMSACLTIAKCTADAQPYAGRAAGAEQGRRHFHQLQADLYSYARTKLLKLGAYQGMASNIESSPCIFSSDLATPQTTPRIRAATWPVKHQRQVHHELPPSGLRRTVRADSAEYVHSEADDARSDAGSTSTRDVGDERPSIDGDAELATDNEASTSDSTQVHQSQNGRARWHSRTSSASSIDLNSNSNGHMVVDEGSDIGTPVGYPPEDGRDTLPAEFSITSPTDVRKQRVHSFLSPSQLQQALNSQRLFEDLYIEVAFLAAESYRDAGWFRNAALLDGEIGALHYCRKEYEFAVAAYARQCALYHKECWTSLLAKSLPRLAESQRRTGDIRGMIATSLQLLSLPSEFLLDRQFWQEQLVSGARAEEGVSPLTEDASGLLLFAPQDGPLMEVCAGDAATLTLAVHSGFPHTVVFDSLSVSLCLDQSGSGGELAGIVVARTEGSEEWALVPGENHVPFSLTVREEGDYIPLTLYANLGALLMQSHACRQRFVAVGVRGDAKPSSAADSESSTPSPLARQSMNDSPFDVKEAAQVPLRYGPEAVGPVQAFTRPAVQASPERPRVEAEVVQHGPLVLGQPQWLPLLIRPLHDALTAAELQIMEQAGLQLDAEEAVAVTTASDQASVCPLKHGVMSLPAWADTEASIIWLRLRAATTVQSVASTRITPSGSRQSSQGASPAMVPMSPSSEQPDSPPMLDISSFLSAATKATFAEKLVGAVQHTLSIVLVNLRSQLLGQTLLSNATLSLEESKATATLQGSLLPLRIGAEAQAALLFMINIPSPVTSASTGQLVIEYSFPPCLRPEYPVPARVQDESRALTGSASDVMTIPVALLHVANLGTHCPALHLVNVSALVKLWQTTFLVMAVMARQYKLLQLFC
eukprot:jgi/Chlat1/3862/Chrsp26S04151